MCTRLLLPRHFLLHVGIRIPVRWTHRVGVHTVGSPACRRQHVYARHDDIWVIKTVLFPVKTTQIHTHTRTPTKSKKTNESTRSKTKNRQWVSHGWFIDHNEKANITSGDSCGFYSFVMFVGVVSSLCFTIASVTAEKIDDNVCVRFEGA